MFAVRSTRATDDNQACLWNTLSTQVQARKPNSSLGLVVATFLRSSDEDSAYANQHRAQSYWFIYV